MCVGVHDGGDADDTQYDHADHSAENLYDRFVSSMPAVGRKLSQFDGGDRTPVWIELLVINDRARYMQRNDPNFSPTEDVVNVMDSLFREGGFRPPIRIRLVCQMWWAFANPIEYLQIPSSGIARSEIDPHHLLRQFNSYRVTNKATLPHHDNAQLYSGEDFQGSQNGLALPSTMCKFPLSGSVNQVTPRSLALNAAIVAHEMGHNLGMNHDSQNNACPQSGYIMSAVLVGVPTQWSECSNQYLATFWRLNPPTCLATDEPAVGRSEPDVCGDGIVGPTEDCDCGAANCRAAGDPCCDGMTCKLVPGAKCTNDRWNPCCRNCQIIRAEENVMCRPANQQECDVPEFCDGQTSRCPMDIFAPPGGACVAKDMRIAIPGKCYQGICWSHQAQCYAQNMKEPCNDPWGSISQSECGDLWCVLSDGCGLVMYPDGGRMQIEDGISCGGPNSGKQCFAGSCLPSSQLPGGAMSSLAPKSWIPEESDGSDYIGGDCPPDPFSSLSKPTPTGQSSDNDPSIFSVRPFPHNPWGNDTVQIASDQQQKSFNYEKTENAALPGNNDGTYYGSVADCLRSCDLEPSCRSLDYFKNEQKCTWSTKTKSEVEGGLRTDWADNPFDYYEKLQSEIILYRPQSFTVTTGQSSSYRIAEPYGTFTGRERMFWTDRNDCLQPSTSLSLFGTFNPRQPGTTTDITLEGVRPGQYFLCFDSGSGVYDFLDDVKLDVAPIQLTSPNSWTRETGQLSSTFDFVVGRTEGAFSGYESVFWTRFDNCRQETQDPAVYSYFRKGSKTGVTETPFTFRNINPGLYRLCYDDGSLPSKYTLMQDVQLDLQGVTPMPEQSFMYVTGSEPEFYFDKDPKNQGEFSGYESVLWVPSGRDCNTPLGPNNTVDGMPSASLGGKIQNTQGKAMIPLSLLGVRPGMYELCYSASARNYQKFATITLEVRGVRIKSLQNKVGNSYIPFTASPGGRTRFKLEMDTNNNSRGTFSGFERVFWTKSFDPNRPCDPVVTNSSSAGVIQLGALRSEVGFEEPVIGLTSEMTLKIPLGSYNLCYNDGSAKGGPGYQDYTYFRSILLDVNGATLVLPQAFQATTGDSRRFVLKSETRFSGTESFYWSRSTKECTGPETPYSGIGYIEAQADGADRSSEVSLLGHSPGTYFLCFNNGDGLAVHYREITLDLEPAILKDKDHGNIRTGQIEQYTFESTAGLFSGAETFFWTQAPDCSYTRNVVPNSWKPISSASSAVNGKIDVQYENQSANGGSVNGQVVQSTPVTMLEAALGVYYLCYNDGLGVFKYHANSFIRVNGIVPYRPQHFQWVSGRRKESFSLSERTKGRFNGMERMFWSPTKGDCSMENDPIVRQTLFANLSTGTDTHPGLSESGSMTFDRTAPGNYYLCFDNSDGKFVSFPLVELELSGVNLVNYNSSFTFITGEEAIMDFSTLALGSRFTGAEIMFWTPVKSCDVEQPIPNLQGQINTAGRVFMDLNRVAPGLYYLCFHNQDSNGYLFYPSIQLRVLGVELDTPVNFQKSTGQETQFQFTESSRGHFSGHEVFSWTPTNDCGANFLEATKTFSASITARMSGQVSAQTGETEPMSLLGVKVGSYRLCYDSGNGTYVPIPLATLLITTVQPAPVDFGSFGTGERQIFTFQPISGQFTTTEVFYWSKAGCSRQEYRNDVATGRITDPSGTTSEVSLFGLSPGTYALCLSPDDSADSFQRYDQITMTIQGASLGSGKDFFRFTGERSSFELKAPTGSFAGGEQIFWTSSQSGCTNPPTNDSSVFGTITNVWSRAVTQADGSTGTPEVYGTTSLITLQGVLPGKYYLCYHNLNGLWNLRRDHALTVAAVNPEGPSLHRRITGTNGKFELKESTPGRFSGQETMYWTPENGCADQTSSEDSIRSGKINPYEISSGSANTTDMSLRGMAPKIYRLCFNDGGGIFIFYPYITLEITGVVPDSQQITHTIGDMEGQGLRITHSGQGSFSSLENIFWVPSAKTNLCKQTDNELPQNAHGRLLPDLMGGGKVAYISAMSFQGMAIGEYTMCYDDGSGSYRLHNTVLNLQGVSFEEFFEERSTGQKTSFTFSHTQPGTFSGTEGLFWASPDERNCDVFPVRKAVQGSIYPNGTTSEYELTDVIPGDYSGCFIRSPGLEAIPLPDVRLRIVGVKAADQWQYRETGRATQISINLNASMGKLHGAERIYYINASSPRRTRCPNEPEDTALYAEKPNVDGLTFDLPMLGAIPGDYELCYDEGMGFFMRYPETVLTVTGILPDNVIYDPLGTKKLTWTGIEAPSRPLVLSAYTGEDKYFDLIQDQPRGMFTGLERIVWTDRNCRIPEHVAQEVAGSLDSRGMTSEFSLKGLKVQNYSLCYDDGRNTFFMYPRVILSLNGIKLAAQSFERLTGQVTTFNFAKASPGDFSGYETVYWTKDSNCSRAQTTSVYGSLDQNGQTTSMTLDNAKPASYTLCYDDGAGDFLHQPHVQLLLVGVHLDMEQAFSAITGEPQSFNLSSTTSGKFTGIERLFWTQLPNCSVVVQDPSTYARVNPDGVTTMMTLLGVAPGEHRMCFDNGEGTFVLTDTTLNVSGVSLAGTLSEARTTGEPTQFDLTVAGAGQFSGYERIFWTNTNCSLDQLIATDYWDSVNGKISATGNKTGKSSYITLDGLPILTLFLCYNNGERSDRWEPYPNLQLSVTGISLLPANFTRITGSPTSFNFTIHSAGHFSGFEAFFWQHVGSSTPCKPTQTTGPAAGRILKYKADDPPDQGLSTTVSLLNLPPGKYRFCFDNGRGGALFYNMPHIIMDLRGVELGESSESTVFSALTGEPQILDLPMPETGVFYGGERFFWSRIRGFCQSPAPSSGTLDGIVSATGRTSLLTFVGAQTGNYTLCFDSDDSGEFANIATIQLNIDGVELVPGQHFEITTGRPTTFEFFVTEGQISGHETIFWTLNPDCTIINTDPSVFGSLSSTGNRSGTTSVVTFAGVYPGTYRACFNDGVGTYAYLKDTSLNVLGISPGSQVFYKYTLEQTTFEFGDHMGEFTGREKIFWAPEKEEGCIVSTRGISIFPNAGSSTTYPITLTDIDPQNFHLCLDDGSGGGLEKYPVTLVVLGVVPDVPEEPFQRYTGQTTQFEFTESTPGSFTGKESFFWSSSSSCDWRKAVKDNVTFAFVDAGDARTISQPVTLLGLVPGTYSLCFSADAQSYLLYPEVKLEIKPVQPTNTTFAGPIGRGKHLSWSRKKMALSACTNAFSGQRTKGATILHFLKT